MHVSFLYLGKLSCLVDNYFTELCLLFYRCCIFDELDFHFTPLPLPIELEQKRLGSCCCGHLLIPNISQIQQEERRWKGKAKRREKGGRAKIQRKSRANQSLCRQLFSCPLRLPQAEQSTPPLLCEFCHALCCPSNWSVNFKPHGRRPISVCWTRTAKRFHTSHTEGVNWRVYTLWGCLTSSQYMQRAQAHWLKYVLVIPLSFLRIATVIVAKLSLLACCEFSSVRAKLKRTS